MFKATLKYKPGLDERVSLTLHTDVPQIFSMTKAEACNVRHWMAGIGESGLKAPLEVTIGGILHFFYYEEWAPMYKCLNDWYDTYLNELNT